MAADRGPDSLPLSPEGDRTQVREGSTVDKYTIVRILGHGGMGAVYEARHQVLDRRFAIKFLLPRHAENPEVLRRFKNEAKAAGRLEHPNLAAVTDFGLAEDGSPYIVMEFLQGQDCAHLLNAVGALPVWRAANIVVQACRGLAVAHKAGIVHRDLKPENLFITDAGDGTDQIRVLDFGIAKLQTVDAGVVTGTGQMYGTAYYMSPEQARGLGDVDERADIWSLGVVLYELLSGRKPFQGQQVLDLVYQIQTFEPPSLAGLRPGLPPGLVRIVERAMAKNVSQRIPSAMALAEGLLPFVSPNFGGDVFGSNPHIPADAMAATMATPATGVGRARSGGPLPGGPLEEEPTAAAPHAGSPSRGVRISLTVGALLLLALVVGAVLMKTGRAPVSTSVPVPPPLPKSSSSASPSPLTGTASGPSPPVAAPSLASPGAAILSRPAPPPVVAAPPVVNGPSANGVRTLFEGTPPRSNKRAARPRPISPRAEASTAPSNPAPTLPVAPSGRPIYIDKGDPFSP